MTRTARRFSHVWRGREPSRLPSSAPSAPARFRRASPPRRDRRRAGAVLAGLMLAIAVVDHRRMVIPDELNALAFIAGLIAAGIGAEAAPGSAILQALVRAASCSRCSSAFAPAIGHCAEWREWASATSSSPPSPACGSTGLSASRRRIAALSALASALSARVRGDGVRPESEVALRLFFSPAIWICWLLIAWRGDWVAP